MLAAAPVTSVRRQSVKTEVPAASSTSGAMAGVRGSSVREFCDWETANASCPGRDELVVVRSARYGRLRLNRCAAKSYGNLGCGADVTAMFAGTCSARRSCHVTVISLHGIQTTCPSDLKAYLELTYDCVKGRLRRLWLNYFKRGHFGSRLFHYCSSMCLEFSPFHSSFVSNLKYFSKTS